ncbi:FGGY-family carbohydrate kinase [Victivallis sp. Marseille-Q1083]|uniref:xylulokinase n=1 Tax=Victivallis sp. Marseille-Q1083 TaxID=2717288 RepID=UPI0015897354|nr:FGGY family carbohydrate kinase [Victivallis sp. Marseille-Q1083]
MNNHLYFLGLDIGTTAVKAAVFDPAGIRCGSALVEYRLETPAPDIVELNPELYWQAAQQAMAAAVGQSGLAPARIAALAVTGQAETLIGVDRDGRAVRPAIVWLDNRAKAEAAELERQFGREKLFRLSGQPEMLPAWPAAKILWLRRHEPEAFRRTAKFLMVEDYIAWHLTGQYATCRGLLPSSSYYNLTTGRYAPEMLDFLGITQRQLPTLFDPGQCYGPCRRCNSVIAAGTPVAAAPFDHIAGALGAGCVMPGTIAASTGSSLAIFAESGQLCYDEQRRIGTYCSFRPGAYALLPWAPTAGMLLKYFRDQFAGEVSYAELDALAAAVPPGSDGLLLLPHCAGSVSPLTNPGARGVAYGITLAHHRGHWARAVMEAVAALLRDNLAALPGRNTKIREIRLLGGPARSPLWRQIIADTLGLPVTLTSGDETPALGAAMLAAIAAGFFPSPEAAADAMVRIAERVQPGENARYYAEYFRQYQQLNQLLMPTFGGRL